jgi:enediyne biosynthesis protein E4
MRSPVLCAFLFSAVCLAQNPSLPVPRFEDVSKRAGLNVPHLSSPEDRYIVESMSGGVGFIDCDNDGKLDILTINGSSVERYRKGGDLLVTLYHQDADLKFTDITLHAGLTRKGWGMGLAVADYDNDGLPDIFIAGFGGNALYHNLGDCKFEDVTEKAGLRGGDFAVGPSWADYDRDGFVDLYVPGYVSLNLDHLPDIGSDPKSCVFRGVKVQCGPRGLPGQPNHLFRNRGNGTFEDVSKRAGVDDPQHTFGMQSIWGDYDNDGWPDLYVTNDGDPNLLFHNKHDGTFEEVGLITGTALSLDGREKGGMGADFGDFAHDGLLALHVTNFVDEADSLYWNQGKVGFTEIATAAGLSKETGPLVGWGNGFFDVDNDGWLDILSAYGHVYPQMDQIAFGAHYQQPVLLFRNKRDRTFENVSLVAGLDKLPPASHRGVAFGDVNNDGKVDVLILNVGQTPTLLINRTESGNHPVMFHLVGTKSNKAAIGARVTVTTGKMVQFSEVRGGGSYNSQNDLRQHFGLGEHTVMDKIEVSWPSGQKDILENLPADMIYTVVEGSGVEQKTPFAGGTREK